jgi:signal transduction histidine kinase
VKTELRREPLSPRRAGTALASFLVLAIGLVVVAGWILDLPALKSVLPGLIAMQPATAVAMLLSGVALLAASDSRAPSFVATGAAALVLVVALQSLAQFVSGVDFGSDRLLFREAVMNQPVAMLHPGRMAETTAVSFALAALALLLARAHGRTAGLLFSACATAILAAISLTLLGYLFEAAPLPGLFGFTNVALPTATGLGALAIGLLALRPEVGWVRLLQGESIGAAVARRLLPVVIVVPVVAAWLAFLGWKRGLYSAEIRLALLTCTCIALLSWITIWAATRLNRMDAIRRTEQSLRESEKRLAQSQAELLHMSRVSEQGVMGSTLAHELNQPLTAATNYVSAGQRLLAQAPQPGLREAKYALRNAQACISQAAEIIRKLRAFVSKGTVETAPHNLHQIIEDSFIFALTGRVLKGAGTSFDFDRAVQRVNVDPIQIQQVIINLVRNAVDAMEGQPRREVRVSTRRVDGQMAEVSVADSGAGFAAGPPEDLFSPFTSTKGSGMGLGLSISRTIVEAHGGRIWAENVEGGAVFRFTLPLGAAPAEQPAVAS